ncbi:MAG: AAA family ATPase [Pontiellaceae bacterium]|nr:AAA family ATPase [Pontiellaceae bacterium]MBN2784104.1 AAA family ATPase [Pontiellaceae bacterium]
MENQNRTTNDCPAVARQLRCIAIGSGKGGVGKTTVSVGLSHALVDLGYRVLLFDADMGLANVDLQMGLEPKFTLQDVVYGGCSLERAIIASPGAPDVLASSSGAREMVSLNEVRREMLVDELISFSARYDFLIIDTEAGIGPGAIAFLQTMPQVNIVVMNEPTSVMDAYSLIKILSGMPHPPEVRLIINNVKSEREGLILASRLNEATKRFLGRTFEVSGIILHDLVVGDAIRARQSVLHFAPESAPALGLRNLARSVLAANKARESSKALSRSAFETITKIGNDGKVSA